MGVVEMLRTQRKTVEAKIAELREELADIDIALRAIEARKASLRPAQGSLAPTHQPVSSNETGSTTALSS